MLIEECVGVKMTLRETVFSAAENEGLITEFCWRTLLEMLVEECVGVKLTLRETVFSAVLMHVY